MFTPKIVTAKKVHPEDCRAAAAQAQRLMANTPPDGFFEAVDREGRLYRVPRHQARAFARAVGAANLVNGSQPDVAACLLPAD